MLILAVVAIREVSEGGIITKAKEAKSATTVAQEKEQIGLAVNEWSIQKNYATNTQNFKSFMTEKLTNVATVDGNDAGPLTLTMKDTSNVYTVKDDGTITGPKKIENNPDLDYIETYFMGVKNETTGERPKNINITTLFTDMSKMKFSDTNIKYGGMPYERVWEMYVRYNQTPYKIILDGSSYVTTSVTALETEGRKGQYVSYNGQTWIILYDDDKNGLQMISAESLQYNGAEFNLGYNDSLITDWDSLITEADLDESEDLSNFEKSVYSYNKAIETLNTACKSFVKQTDITSGKIIDVRCVGSNPTNKNSETETLYESDNLKIWPKDNSDYAVGIGNGIGKSTDTNYETDFEQMKNLAILSTENLNYYWLASRFVSERSSDVSFIMRYVDSSGVRGDDNLWYVLVYDAYGRDDSKLLRPVVTLKSDISFSGSGTADDPYTF